MYEIEEIQRKFEEFVSNYRKNLYIVNAKKDHIYNVANNCMEIAKSLNLSNEDIKVAYLIGILHDIGRFDQIEEENELKDNSKFDHGDHGYQLLKNGLLQKFINVRYYDDIILTAVRQHNKEKLNKSLTKREALFCKILRDADKIDILRRLNDKSYTYDYEFDKNDQISEEVKERFYEEKSIPFSLQKNKMDQVVTRLALVYDLNYEYSFERVKQKNYLDKYIENLDLTGDNKTIIEDMKKYANGFMENEIEKNIKMS